MSSSSDDVTLANVVARRRWQRQHLEQHQQDVPDVGVFNGLAHDDGDLEPSGGVFVGAVWGGALQLVVAILALCGWWLLR